MDKNKGIYYIENSFLSSLISHPEVTDISYNGKDIYYVSNTFGRKKSEIVIEHQLAKDFIRQIANVSEKKFSYTNPRLDISIGRYRINAIHQSIGRIDDEGVLTFSIRIASKVERINKNSDFLTEDIYLLIQELLKKRQSIVIGGITGSGKTEFQKFLLRNMPENERVIVIDNVQELEQIRNEKIDLTCWQVDENVKEASAHNLIKSALRNNPDWLLLAEARGEEMVDILNSAMTGLPIITTIHAFDAYSLPYRMGRMMMKSEQKIDYREALKDINYHFHYFFYLNKEMRGGKVKRYISEIIYSSSKGEATLIYQKDKKKDIYQPLTKEAIKALKLEEDSPLFRSKFIKRD